MFNKLRIRARYDLSSDLIEFVAYTEHQDGTKSYGKPLVMEKSEKHVMPDRIFGISHEQATLLMDDLWTDGIRPTRFKDNSEEVSALKAHIDHLWAIVKKTLKIEEG